MRVVLRVGLAVMVVLGLLLGGPPPARAERPLNKTRATYVVPDVTLVDQDGVRVKLRDLVDPSRPTLVQFIFTSCGSICPIMAATFGSVQKRLGDDASAVRLVSISIDPETDTPEKMKAFLKRFDAKPGWSFLTGSRNDIRAVMKAFDALVEDKMAHAPLTFVASPADKSWFRISELVSAADLTDEVKKTIKR